MSKIVLITGASSGIGAATATLLADEGHRLILCGRRQDRLETLAETCGVPCHILTFDITDRAATIAAIESLPVEWQAVDVLINNAGLALNVAPADACPLEDWDIMIATNVQGLLTMSRTLLPAMRARGVGHIINVSSIAGSYAYPGSNVYGATKAFVSYFSQALRSDLLGSPVRVSNIEPGMVETEFSNVRFKGDDARADDVYKGVQPLVADDIAETIRWCMAQPAHVNINRVEVMPVMQALGGPKVHRE